MINPYIGNPHRYASPEYVSYENKRHHWIIQSQQPKIKPLPTSPEDRVLIDSLVIPSICGASLGFVSTLIGGVGLATGAPLIGAASVFLGGGVTVTSGCLYYLIQYAAPAAKEALEKLKAEKASK